MGHRASSLVAGLVLTLCGAVLTADHAAAAGAPTVASGFVELTSGYQRLPAVGARYMDGDIDVAGGADPRWQPWNPGHLAVAEARAKAPDPGVRGATQHAYLLSLRGDKPGAEAGLAAAKQRYPDSVGVHWSEGWIRLNLLDFEGALVAWQQAERLHGGQPFWVPYSKAIALIGAGDGEAALAWWQLAQSTYAPELDSANAARQKFQHWRIAEKALLEEVIDLAYPEDAGIAAVNGSGPEMIDTPLPHYPPALQRQGIEGVTMVRIDVDAAGLAVNARVETSSGYAEMDAEALKVARLARFKAPAGPSADGFSALVPYRFSLDPALLAPPPAGSRQAEVERIIEQRRAQMRAEAAKVQAGPQGQ
jgi:TonB family protein